MATETETEEPRTDFEPEPEEGGGPVKTFLEHLEDLRWLLIKSGSAVLVSLIVCLYAAPQIVWVLKQPLKNAALIQAGRTQQKAIVRIGSNVVATIEPTT